MQLFLLDQKKITKLMLPDIIEGVYSIDYKSEKSPVKKHIKIEAQNNKWVFISNGEVNAIQNGIETAALVMDDYDYFFVKIANSQENLLLFPMPLYEKENYKLMTSLETITIGNDETNDICYKNEFIQQSHAKIIKEKGSWYLTCPKDNGKAVVYLNDNIVFKKELKMGDIIFIYGLKILWLTNFMYVYNIQNKVTITNASLQSYVEEQVDNSNYLPVSDKDASIELYNVNDYFFHTIRINSKINDKKLILDPPPTKQEPPESSFLITMGGSVVMLSSAFVTVNSILKGLQDSTKSIGDFTPQIVMVGAMIFGSVFMPQITKFYQKRMLNIREKKRQKEYNKYIENKVQEIETIIADQKKILRENNPTLLECYGIATSTNFRTRWSREIKDDDFLSIRLGIGTMPARLSINPISDTFTMEKDNLKDLAIAVANKKYYLEEMPVTFSFIENRTVALICDSSFEQDYINGLILQLATFHSASDLKLVFLLNDSNINKWDYAKFLPHCLNGTKDNRFFANGLKEIKTVCSYLEEVFNYRSDVSGNTDNDQYKYFDSYYLIITNDYFAVKNIAIINKILNVGGNMGFSLLIIEQSMQRIPNQCKVFLQVLEPNSYVFLKDSGDQTKFTPEYDTSINMRDICHPLAKIPLFPPGDASSLPKSLTFLDMYKVSKIEQLNASNRWKENNPTVSLQAAVGVQSNGDQFFLDLHEKFHGPHGLVAGTTGSGKSEFLITFLLSLSINYHPREVQFIIIDYKGGGLAGAFENRQTGAKVPHLVGTITNLDVSEMNRTLVSFNSEIKRRQKIFNNTRDKLGEGTIDIYKYQQYYRDGLVDEPMAHLIIVSDEFAELKSQQPEFMDELISIARIGRSLGIHLILATQKPTGVVTDQIWSNSKFKVCLKVQDKSDSMEMLKRPDAASLKEVGRFYLQVGYDEYFDIGQSGWAGAKYNPSKQIKKTDDSINFIDNTGYFYKTINDVVKKEINESKSDQLTSIVKYLIDIAAKENFQAKQLWRSIIPGEIFINDLKTKYNYKRFPFSINPIIGEYDNPKSQFQGLLTLNISSNGNTLIYGMTGSGKENLLSTIVYSIITNHHPSEVNIYIIDMGAEILKMYDDMPHVGDVCLIDEEEKIRDLINLVSKEIVRRKQLFVDYNGSYIDYCKNSGNFVPSIIIMINNYEVLNETYEKFIEPLTILYRDANKFGIYFVVTTSGENTMRTRAAETFNNKICLQMPNDDAYRNIVGAPRNLRPLKVFGRGLILLEEGTFEFQSAYITNSSEISYQIKRTAEVLKQYNYKAKRIPVLPKSVTLDYVDKTICSLNNIPIGINVETKEICTYNFTSNKINIINTFDMQGNSNFFHAFIKMLKMDNNLNLRVIDLLNIIDRNKIEVDVFNDKFDQIVLAIDNEIANDEKATQNHLYLFIGISELKNKLNKEIKEKIDTIFSKSKTYKKSYFIFADNYDSYKNFQTEPWYSSEVNKRFGIWLGYGVDEQYAIDFPNLSISDRKIKEPEFGFVASRSERVIFKKIVLTAEDSHE